MLKATIVSIVGSVLLAPGAPVVAEDGGSEPGPAGATFSVLGEPGYFYAFYYHAPGSEPVLIDVGATTEEGVATVVTGLPPEVVQALPELSFLLFTWPLDGVPADAPDVFTMSSNLSVFVEHEGEVHPAGAAAATEAPCPPMKPAGAGWCWEPHASITYAPGEMCFRELTLTGLNSRHCCYNAAGMLSAAHTPPHTDAVNPACGRTVAGICFYCSKFRVILHLIVDTIPGWLS